MTVGINATAANTQTTTNGNSTNLISKGAKALGLSVFGLPGLVLSQAGGEKPEANNSENPIAKGGKALGLSVFGLPGVILNKIFG